MLKKLLIVSACIVVLHLPFSCGSNCEDSLTTVTITELGVSFGALSTASLLERTSTTVDSATFFVTIEAVDEVVGLGPGFGGLSTVAMAEDCAFFSTLSQSPERITITSSEPVVSGGLRYDAGSSLNALFEGHVAGNPDTRFSVAELLEILQEDGNGGWAFLNRSLAFQFREQPDTDLSQTFSFSIEFPDQTFTVSTTEVGILVP